MMISRLRLPSLALICMTLMLLGGAMWPAAPATAQAPAGTIKIGTLFDHTGPFAERGSLNAWRGAKMIIDYVNEHGGILGKYRVVQVDGDSQSKGDIALNEAERLLNVEKVDILAGVYSSAHAVPLAERVAPDLSSLVTKLRAARPDVIFHTGYNPDIALFLRQAKEGGLRMRAYIGHGAGHGQIDKLRQAFPGIEGFHNVDPASAQLLDPKGLRPGVWTMTQEMVRRYRREFGQGPIAPHVSMGFNNLWVLLNDVLPRAIKKYGGVSPDAIARGAST